MPAYHLKLMGPFRLATQDGHRIEVPSKKGIALIAMLATAPDGERSRNWLQERLWGSRGPLQANNSLRRELSNLRRWLNRTGAPLLVCFSDRARLDLDQIGIDIHEPRESTPERAADDFLEGLDIQEEGFEDWLRLQRRAVQRSTMARDAHASLPAPPAPSSDFLRRPMLAVLRFANRTRDTENDYLAEGLSEDLIDRLSRLRWIPVAARGSSFSHSTETSTIREIGKALDARYIVEGQLGPSKGGLEIIASMSNAESGQSLWTGRRSFAAETATARLADLITEIAAALSNQIDHAEMARAVAMPAESNSVTDLLWRARWHYNRYTRADVEIAEGLLAQALACEPNSPEALVQLAYFRQRQMWVHRSGVAEIIQLRKLAQRTISADYRDGRGYLVAGIAEVWLRNTSAAIGLLEKALELNPSLAYAYAQIGAAHYLNDQPNRALPMFGNALRLDMGEQYSYYVHGEMAMSHAMIGNWDEAIATADRSLLLRPAYWFAHLAKIHSLSESGGRPAAMAAVGDLYSKNPRFDLSFLDWVPFVRSIWPDRLKKTFRIITNT